MFWLLERRLEEASLLLSCCSEILLFLVYVLDLHFLWIWCLFSCYSLTTSVTGLQLLVCFSVSGRSFGG